MSSLWLLHDPLAHDTCRARPVWPTNRHWVSSALNSGAVFRDQSCTRHGSGRRSAWPSPSTPLKLNGPRRPQRLPCGGNGRTEGFPNSRQIGLRNRGCGLEHAFEDRERPILSTGGASTTALAPFRRASISWPQAGPKRRGHATRTH